MLGDRVTGLQGARAKPPLFLFLYPWTIRDIFLNISLQRRKYSVPHFVPRQGQGHFRLFNRLCPYFCPSRCFTGTGTFSIVCPLSLGTFSKDMIEFVHRLCPCPSFCPSTLDVCFCYNFFVLHFEIAIIFDPSSDCFFTYGFAVG